MRVSCAVYADFNHSLTVYIHPRPTPARVIPTKTIPCFDDIMYSQEPVIYTKQSDDEDVVHIFVDKSKQNIKDIHDRINFPKKMIFSKTDKAKPPLAGSVRVCLGKKRYVTTVISLESLEEQHTTNVTSSINYRRLFPVLFHNQSGYDSTCL